MRIHLSHASKNKGIRGNQLRNGTFWFCGLQSTDLGRRKLPPVPSSLIVPVPIDNPALHQGRVRTTPHVEGQFTAHVYVSFTLSRRSKLYLVIQDILSDAKIIVPTLQDIWSTTERPTLHISLSRPIFLRAHQREDLKRAVKTVAKGQKRFVRI